MTAALRRPAALIGLALAATIGALVATPSTACACSTKTPAYISALKGELRTLGRFQRDFFVDSGRIASRSELEALGWTPPPNGVELVAFETTDTSVRAVTTSPTYLPGATCTLELHAADIRADPYADDILTCAGLPQPGRDERRAVIWYVVLFAGALLARVAVAGRSRPAIGLGTAGGFLVLAVVHPFWFMWNSRDWCNGGLSVGILWIGFLAAYILRTALFSARTPPPARA